MNTKQATLRDLLLPILVVAVVGMMVFPLPNLLLDTLLMLNIAFSLSLIVACVYLSEPEKFTSLPTILLLTTLFRLGLNISTTRQILSTGEAPQIVVTFGQFVVSGNMVVGTVIFLIVTVIQFLVVAKGAERVAEVAARFTLDAMPGKQMAIDADVRAGVLSLLEAKEKRLELQSESKLYGALDGAMKFIKGDCIAGILIALVNISAGLVVGMVYHGLSLAQAFQRFTLFTIGDGLCSQIPALLVAVSSGIVVTRVADRDGSFVGRDIFLQLTREPQALSATGGTLIVLTLVPGFPKVLFLVLGGLFFVGGALIRIARRDEVSQGKDSSYHPKVFSVLAVRLSPHAVLAIQGEKLLVELLRQLKSDIFESRGILVPEVQFEVDPILSDTEFVLLHNGVVVQSRVCGDVERADSVSKNLSNLIEEYISGHLAELVDDTQVRMLLDLHSPVCEDLINSIIPSVLTVTGFTQIVRNLVSECVSVRNLPSILQAIAEHKEEKEHGYLPYLNARAFPPVLKEQVRSLQHANGVSGMMSDLLADIRVCLGRSICMAHSKDGETLGVWVLDAQIDRELTGKAMSNAVISPDVIRSINTALYEVIEREGRDPCDASNPLIVLTSRYARSPLAGLLLSQGLSARAVAAEEIPSSLKLTVCGTLGGDSEIEKHEAEVTMSEELADCGYDYGH